MCPAEYSMDNDYTISETTARRKDLAHGFVAVSTITRTFNFLAQQVTTHTLDALMGNSGGYKIGGTSGINSSQSQQHFDDFRSDGEIIFMHEKLTALGGKPPAIEDITRSLGKKPAGLAAKG